MKRYVTLALLLLTLAVPALAQTPSQSPPTPSRPSAQDEFVPVSAPMNPQDTIPAPRLVAIAYGFIWVVIFAYVWSVRSRLASVERELQTVSKRIGAERR